MAHWVKKKLLAPIPWQLAGKVKTVVHRAGGRVVKETADAQREVLRTAFLGVSRPKRLEKKHLAACEESLVDSLAYADPLELLCAIETVKERGA